MSSAHLPPPPNNVRTVGATSAPGYSDNLEPAATTTPGTGGTAPVSAPSAPKIDPVDRRLCEEVHWRLASLEQTTDHAGAVERVRAMLCEYQRNNAAKLDIANFERSVIHFDYRVRFLNEAILRSRHHALSMVKVLIEESIIDPNLADDDVCKYTPLIMAIKQNDVDVIKYLVENCKLDLDYGDLHDQTALIWTAIKGLEEIAQLLLEAGANPNARTKTQNTALYWSMQNGHVAHSLVLIKHPFTLLHTTNTHGQTPFSSGCNSSSDGGGGVCRSGTSWTLVDLTYNSSDAAINNEYSRLLPACVIRSTLLACRALRIARCAYCLLPQLPSVIAIAVVELLLQDSFADLSKDGTTPLRSPLTLHHYHRVVTAARARKFEHNDRTSFVTWLYGDDYDHVTANGASDSGGGGHGGDD